MGYFRIRYNSINFYNAPEYEDMGTEGVELAAEKFGYKKSR